MIRNKFIYKSACMLLMLAGMTSCNDWLDVQPASQVEDSELFETETGFKEALSGVYSSMVSESTYAKEMLFGAMGVLAQEWNNYPTTTYQDLSDYQYDATYPSQTIANIWSTSYNSIVNVNNLLSHIDAKKNIFAQNNYNIIKGEALALRAFLHFDLLRCFGVSYEQDPNMPSIPYCTEMSYKVSPQLTVQQVAEKVINDLLNAAELLKVDPILTGEEITELDDNGYLMNRQVHLNYYAVKGLLARVYMWTHNYNEALLCAQEVIKSQKFPWSKQLDMEQGNDNSCATEQLFALNNINLSTLADSYFNEESNSTNFSLNSETLLEYYNRNTVDYRYLYQFKNGTQGEFIDNRYLTKYNPSESDDTYYTNKMSLIRIGEMYLIASECNYRINNTGLDELNELRVARNLMPLESLPTDYYDELIKEYRRELIGEGQLFFLYKRFNLASITGSDADMIGEKAYTFPLPLSETDAAQRNNNR